MISSHITAERVEELRQSAAPCCVPILDALSSSQARVERLEGALREVARVYDAGGTRRTKAQDLVEAALAETEQTSGAEEPDTREDRPLPEDAAIKAAHPARTDKHALYSEAMRLVGARHSKRGLVELVNWLLSRIPPGSGAETAENGADAERAAVLAYLNSVNELTTPISDVMEAIELGKHRLPSPVTAASATTPGKDCPICEGSGELYGHDFGGCLRPVDCPACHGTGNRVER